MTAELQQVFEDTGFSTREAEVYLSLIRLGEATPPQVAQDTGIMRGSVHYILDALVDKGWAAERPHDKKKVTKLFRAANPTSVLQGYKEKGAVFEGSLSKFMSINPRALGNLVSENFYGRDGLARVWEMMLDEEGDVLTYFASNYFSGVVAWLSQGRQEERVMESLVDQRVAMGKWIRGITPYEPDHKKADELGILETQKYQLQHKGEGDELLREIYCVPFDLYPFQFELTIFGNKVAITSYMDGSATVITSGHFAEMQRLSFNLAFSAAKVGEDSLLSDKDKALLSSYCQ